MTKDWDVKTIGEVCEVVGGGTPKTAVPEFWSDDIVWVTPKDLGKLDTVEIFDTNKHISHEGLKKSSAKLLPSGSVVMSSRAPIGYVAIAGVELATNQGCRNFVCGDKIHNKYLYYFLFANTALLNSLGEGATFREISGTTIKGINIPVPPIIEQKRLVKILDDKSEAIEDLKRIAKEQLASAKELFESRSEELLTNSEKWQKKTIDDVCTLENGDRGKNYPSNAKLQMEGIPFVSAGNLQQQGIELKGRNFLTDKQYSLLRSGKFTNGDILFCLRGSLGKYAVVQSIDKGAIASSLVIVRPKELVSKEYIMSYFGSGLCKKMVEKYAGGAAQPNLGAKDLKKFLIYLPTLKEQKVICDELATLKKQTKELEQVFRRKITDLEELKKSYLQEAFSGKL